MAIELSSVADAFAREFQCWSSEESGLVMGSLLARLASCVDDEAERAWLVEHATTSGLRLVVDPNENVRERIALCEQVAITEADQDRYSDLTDAYSSWIASGGFAADSHLLAELARRVG